MAPAAPLTVGLLVLHEDLDARVRGVVVLALALVVDHEALHAAPLAALLLQQPAGERAPSPETVRTNYSIFFFVTLISRYRFTPFSVDTGTEPPASAASRAIRDVARLEPPFSCRFESGTYRCENKLEDISRDRQRKAEKIISGVPPVPCVAVPYRRLPFLLSARSFYANDAHPFPSSKIITDPRVTRSTRWQTRPETRRVRNVNKHIGNP